MFTPAVIFPDVVALVVGHLGDVLPVPVTHQVPNPRPVRFVTIRRTGGAADGVVDAAQVTVEVWADTAAQAGALAEQVRAHVRAMAGNVIGGIPVYRVVEFSGPQDLPDPSSTQQRSTFTVAVHVRGVPFPA